MSRAKRLARQIERTMTGPMWHGPALVEVLDGVTADAARTTAVAGVHSIWQIVLHVTAWAEIARHRVHGGSTGDPTPEQDWPPVPGPDGQFASDPVPQLGSGDAQREWPLAVERLSESHRQLAADARRLADEQLDALVPGLEYTVSVLLHGIVEHGTYHGGQIALLKKASAEARRAPAT